MPFDSEEKRSDFAKWAEEMSYEDEKELKRQKKLEEKEQKKAAKLAKKAAKNADADDSEKSSEKTDETGENTESTETTDSVSDNSINDKAEAETSENVENTSTDNTAESNSDSSDKDSTSDDSTSEDSSSKDSSDDEEEEEYNPDYKKVKKKKKSNEVNIVKELLSLIIYIGIIIIICYFIITFVGQRTTVHGHSMETTLQDGDNLWIDKLTYHFKDPKRFDIIVFPYQGQDVYYIKRVIGLPGETVQITPEGNILINGEILSESYGREIMVDSGTASEPRTLGEDEYFVLGDNRNDSRDSRWADVGNINKKDIIGRAVLRLTPFSNFGKLD